MKYARSIGPTPVRIPPDLRARYCHGDYKALARDLGIHESSAKKIVGRLALRSLDYARQ